jgi:hypothetical protein
MWPIKFSGFSWLGVTVLTILVWSNLKNQTILSAGVNNLSPIVVYAEKENTKNDTLPLSPDNWLQKVQQDILVREYNINYSADKKYHQSPNRANNTRITYYPKSIQIAPRTLEELEGVKPTEPNAERKLSKTFEDYTLQLEVKGYGTTKKIVHPFHAETLVSENNEAFAKDERMQVEYINNEEGTRQNFIINQPIKGNELAVHLNINTNLTATQENEGSIKFTGKQNSTQLYYNDLKVWDATGKILPAQMKLCNVGQAYALVLAVNTAGAEYPITIDPIVTNGDGFSDIILGAFNFDNGQSNEGAAFVYHGSASGISTISSIMLECNQVSAYMGASVASAGDVNNDGYCDVIVGAYYYDNGQINEGVFFVYQGSASGINNTPSSMVESNQTGAQMGRYVRGAGDVNGDGYSDVIVGASYYANGQSNEGAAFVYHGGTTGISTTASVVLERDQADSYFGWSVSGAGDVNGDGYSDVIVGAVYYSNGQSQEGAAFVYHGSASGINTTVATMLECNQAAGYLGWSVSSAGDVNGDGYSDVIVGAVFYTNGQSQEGAAFVYQGSASGINSTVAVTLQSNQIGANLGRSVDTAGDVNGDGYSDVIVGALYYSNGQSQEGAAFVYHGSSTGINENAVAMIEGNQIGAEMGYAASSAGDVNGDGYSDVIAGAYFYSNGQTYEGGASVYHGSASGISTTVSAILESNQVNANLGYSVAGAGDVNGDGYSDIIVGAHGYDNGQSDEGAAFVYHGSANGLSTSASAMLESNQAGAQMGYSVSTAGDVNGDGYSDVVVGAHGYDNGQTDEGAAFIYYGSASGLSTSAAVMLESDQVSAYLGYSVAGAGDVNGDGYSDMVVGAYGYSNGQTFEGVAFVHHGSASGISTTVSAVLESNQASSTFGFSVSGAGDVNGDGYSDVVVGAYQYDNGQISEGAAFVYHGSTGGLSTTASAMLESNQANTFLGFSVSGVGDVNGDGYSDVVVGSVNYTNGQTDEGAAFVYHGSASGLSTTAAATLESNQASANMGRSVASAGDVNGDGYSDVVVGAYRYDNGQTDEGVAFVYHGSASGISTAASAMVESNKTSAYMGISVSSAGDVNGDGYNDVIVAAPLYDNGQTDEGAAFIYHGNAGTGRRNNVQLYNTDLSTPLQQSNLNNSSFGLGMFTTSLQGRQKVKMVWEVKNQGQPFSSAGGKITNSVSNTSVQSSYSNTGLTGTNLNNLVSKSGFQTKVRCRVQYDLVTSVTGQKYGPWRYPQGYFNVQQGMGNTPFPVEWLSFNAQWLTAGESALLNWSTASEKDNSHFTLLRSTDGQNWEEVAQINGAGTTSNISQYTYIDNSLKHLNTSKLKHVYYRLMQTDYNGQFSFSEIRELSVVTQSGISVSPNPGTNPVVTLSTSAATDLPYTIIDIQGKEVGKGVITKGSIQQAISLQHLPAGIYLVNVEQDGKLHAVKMVR